MKIRIHRGQNQIGGSIIEITSENTRLFFDVGANLDNATVEVFPNIDGLFTGEANANAIFISHYHSDHMGLLNNVLPNIPIWFGEKAFSVYKAACEYREKNISFSPLFFRTGEEITIGDLKVTPIICDHSAYESYMFIVEQNNKRILYSGDFRANGRLDFKALLQSIPKVDAIIVEGTTVTRETYSDNIEEIQLEDIASKYLSMHNGPVFLMASAMNVERIKTGYNIALNTNRVFLEDIYTADIMCSTQGDYPIPGKKENVKVFITGGDKQYQKLISTYNTVKISKTAIANTRFIMCVRQSMQNYLEKLSEKVNFEDGVLFYGMWKGYMEQPKVKSFLEFMESKGVKIHILHTSGHADLHTIDKLIEKADPTVIIPVHTENPDWFTKYGKPVLIDDYTIEI